MDFSVRVRVIWLVLSLVSSIHLVILYGRPGIPRHFVCPRAVVHDVTVALTSQQQISEILLTPYT